MKGAARFLTPIIFVGLAGIPLSIPRPASAQFTIQWNAEPPNYYNDVGRQAFRQGFQAAHRDWDAHRDMNPWRYPQVRNPPVPGPEREHYRDAFLRGYDEGVHRVRGWDDHDRDNAWRDHDHDNQWRDHDRDHDHDHDHDQYPH